MIGHRMQQQQTPPRQKVSQKIRRAHHPQFFFSLEKKIIATLELELTLKVWPRWVTT